MDVINLCPSQKTECAIFAQKLIADVESGMVNALDLHIKMNAIQNALDVVKKAIADQTLHEAVKYGEKTFAHLGAEVTIAELGVKYDYSHCKDTVWERLDQEELSVKESKKNREAFLKSLKEPMTVVDESTGEMVTIVPPIRKGTTGVKITLI